MPDTLVPSLTLDLLGKSVSGSDSAIRCITKLMPAGGPGDKIFPPTYEGGRYALEQRRIGDRVCETVLLDSVQSQANRMEQALKARAEAIGLPLLHVTIPRSSGYLSTVTSLDAPHRVWDAIFRDSMWSGKAFRDSTEGRTLVASNADDANAFYRYCPTGLIFGMWDSTSGENSSGKVRLARALVSEIVGHDVVLGRKTASRIDPLEITADSARIYRARGGSWTLDEKEAEVVSKKPLLFGKDSKAGKPSSINHGNVMPSISKEDESGGVTVSEAVQICVLSLSQLRRLNFPDGDKTAQRNAAGRTVLAALALYAVAAAQDDGYFLRSRAHLVPLTEPVLEIVGRTADNVQSFRWSLNSPLIYRGHAA